MSPLRPMLHLWLSRPPPENGIVNPGTRKITNGYSIIHTQSYAIAMIQHDACAYANTCQWIVSSSNRRVWGVFHIALTIILKMMWCRTFTGWPNIDMLWKNNPELQNHRFAHGRWVSDDIVAVTSLQTWHKGVSQYITRRKEQCNYPIGLLVTAYSDGP